MTHPFSQPTQQDYQKGLLLCWIMPDLRYSWIKQSIMSFWCLAYLYDLLLTGFVPSNNGILWSCSSLDGGNSVGSWKMSLKWSKSCWIKGGTEGWSAWVVRPEVKTPPQCIAVTSLNEPHQKLFFVSVASYVEFIFWVYGCYVLSLLNSK